MANGLTKKREEFAREVVLSDNASDAYRRVFKPRRASAKTVNEEASRLLADPKVAARVAELRKRAMAVAEGEFDASVERIVRGLAEIGFADPAELFDEAGRMKGVRDMPEHARRTIASVEVLEEFEGKGKDRKLVGLVKKIKFWDKKGALDSLARWRGMFKDATGDDDDASGSTTVTIRLSRADRLLVEAIEGESVRKVSVAGQKRPVLPAPVSA